VLSSGLRALHHIQPNSVSTAELITCLLIAVCHTYVINMLHVCYKCCLLAVGLCTMYRHILNRDSIMYCHIHVINVPHVCYKCHLLAVGLCTLSYTCIAISYTCHKCASCLLQVSSFGSGALHPMWLRSSCKAACTAKPFRCHPAMVSSKTSLRLLLSMLPRSLPADHQLLDASQVPDLTYSSCIQHVLHGACDVRTICVML